MSSRARLALVAAALHFAGCSPDPAATSRGGGEAPTGDGKMWIDWTIDGASPSAAACANVDHLVVDIQYRDGTGVEIEPVTCSLTRLRYDSLPSGPADITLTAVGAGGCHIADATAAITLSPTLPAAPAPTIALPALPACR